MAPMISSIETQVRLLKRHARKSVKRLKRGAFKGVGIRIVAVHNNLIWIDGSIGLQRYWNLTQREAIRTYQKQAAAYWDSISREINP